METFLIKNRTRGMQPFFKNGTEREDRSSTQNGTERERNDKKEERERNNLGKGPRSRTERNGTILKKSEVCQRTPAFSIKPWF